MSKHLGVSFSGAGNYLPDKEVAKHADIQHDEYWGESTVNRAKVRVEQKKEKPFVAISVENKRQVLEILTQIVLVKFFLCVAVARNKGIMKLRPSRCLQFTLLRGETKGKATSSLNTTRAAPAARRTTAESFDYDAFSYGHGQSIDS